jgi:hypothetical protein
VNLNQLHKKILFCHFRSAYDVDLTKSPVIKQAERLCKDLSGINDDVKSVVSVSL